MTGCQNPARHQCPWKPKVPFELNHLGQQLETILFQFKNELFTKFSKLAVGCINFSKVPTPCFS